ncbi:hypothetical protein CDAR_233091 [Caerostris darwini]|uniref:Uncharacterized protein n=1 Tax=Caerostris darwini TaxID=1538125 RepID=A0AAV4Q499_9ARAC|nr:hypothetical protein CDAR_233091 [Caerostris darwini]
MSVSVSLHPAFSLESFLGPPLPISSSMNVCVFFSTPPIPPHPIPKIFLFFFSQNPGKKVDLELLWFYAGNQREQGRYCLTKYIFVCLNPDLSGKVFRK